jgi:ABC-type glycerol-3-phosphate transport system substrate-binding protein
MAALGAYANGTSEEAAGGGQLEDVSWSSIDWPEKLPEAPQPIPDSEYDFVDLSEPMEFEMVTSGFQNTPLPPDDMIREYLEERFNTTIVLRSYQIQDLETNLAARYAAGDGPDVGFVRWDRKALVDRLYENGQLMDASKLIPYMPQFANYVTGTFAKWAGYNEDEWVGFPRYPLFPSNWGLIIRKDWLDNLGMSEPTTVEELYEYAVAVTHEDPDGDGEDDSWFMGGAGSGESFAMIEELRSAFGHPSYNVVDGTINHPMLDGTTRAFLEFLHGLNEEGALSPDWYTIGWGEFKSYSLADKIGMVHYPGGAIASETYNSFDFDVDAVKKRWSPIQPVEPSGKLSPPAGPEGLFVFNKDLAQQPERAKRIARFLDAFAYPNPDYGNLIRAGGPAIFPEDVTYEYRPEDGMNVWAREDGTSVPERYASQQDYQMIGITTIYEAAVEEPHITGSKWNREIIAMPRHANYDLLLSLDPDVKADLTELERRNEVNFVLGQRSFDEWDQYVEEWLERGGRELLDQAAEQLGAEPAGL